MSDLMTKAWDAYWAQENGTEKALERVVALVVEECAKRAAETFTKESVIKNSRGNPYSSGEVAIYASSIIAHSIRQHGKLK